LPGKRCRSEGDDVPKQRQGPGGGLEKAFAFLAGTPISFSYQDSELRYVWFENAPSDWDPTPAPGVTDFDLLPEPAASALVAAKREVLQTGAPRKHELPLGGIAGTRYFDLYLQPDRDESGAIVGLLSAIVDVTERRRSEAIRQTLLREVTHRSKNLLAIVISLATQTSRTARSTQEFLERFNGRLQSLSRSQDLVTETNWRGALLGELISTQVAAYAVDGRQIELAGPDPYLKPNAALHVGLALHELAVNSVQRGALSSPKGHLSVKATRLTDGVEAAPDKPALEMEWIENGEGGVAGPDADEFGHVLLVRLVPAAVGGTARLTAGPDGLCYKLTMLRREFE
jgi:two-component sensor histidine kinase